MSSSRPGKGVWGVVAGMFPPPEYLLMSASGIDISNSSVKVLSLGNRQGADYVRYYGSASLAEEVIDNGDVLDKKELVRAIEDLKSKFGMTYVHVALPEKRAFIFQTTIPRGIAYEDARTVLEAKLEENVPLAPSEAVFDFDFIPGIVTEEGAYVSVSVYAKRVVEDYLDAIKMAGLVPLSCEVESQAIARAIVPRGDKRTQLIVDFGKSTTKFAVVSREVILYSSTVDIGGHALTQAVMKHLGVTAEEADKVKNEQGFYQRANDNGLSEAMMTTVSALTEEVKKRVSYWSDQKDHGKVFAESVEAVLLSGGNSNLQGFPEFLQKVLGIPVSRARVWENTNILQHGIPPIAQNYSLEYASTVGLALRDMYD
jgi:type IV pilus assembly protein PilM